MVAHFQATATNAYVTTTKLKDCTWVTGAHVSWSDYT